MVLECYPQEKHIPSFNQKLSRAMRDNQGCGSQGETEEKAGKQASWASAVASTALASQVPLFHGQKDLIYTCAEFEKASRKLPSPAAFFKNLR